MHNFYTKTVSSLIAAAFLFTNTCYGYNLPKNTKSKTSTLRPQSVMAPVALPNTANELLSSIKSSSAGKDEARREGFEIIVQSGLGDGIGNVDEYTDDDYREAGAEVIATAEEVWSRAHIIIKVKEPLIEGGVNEFELMKGMAKPKAGKLVIGVVKEIKPNEGRAALLPDGVKELLEFAIEINFAESYKGISDISNTLFTYYHFASSRKLTEAVIESGCNAVTLEAITGDASTAPLFVNKEWIVSLIEGAGEAGRIVVPNIVREYKNILGKTLPCLDPMSIVAGIESPLQGVIYLDEDKVKIANGKVEVDNGWQNEVLDSYPDSPSMDELNGRTVLITGSGTAGLSALWEARRLGAKVIISDLKQNLGPLLMLLSMQFGAGKISLCDSKVLMDAFIEDSDILIIDGENDELIERALIRSSLIVGAALVPKGQAPKTIREDTIRRVCDKYPMRRLFVDISEDQGGNFDFVGIDGILDKDVSFTYHNDPVILGYKNSIYYLVANMPGRPGVIAKASSRMLQASRLPYLKAMIEYGLIGAAKEDSGLKAGFSVVKGVLTDEIVANTKDFNFSWTPVDEALKGIRPATLAKEAMSTHLLARYTDAAA